MAKLALRAADRSKPRSKPRTRTHTASVELAASPAAVFRSLVAPSAIRAWWNATSAIVVPEKGGIWATAWGPEDDPDYVTTAKIAVFDRPHRLVLSDYAYKSKSGPLPFEPKFRTTFVIEPRGRGAVLSVVQAGFPAGAKADAFFRGCEVGWATTLKQFAAFVERV